MEDEIFGDKPLSKAKSTEIKQRLKDLKLPDTRSILDTYGPSYIEMYMDKLMLAMESTDPEMRREAKEVLALGKDILPFLAPKQPQVIEQKQTGGTINMTVAANLREFLELKKEGMIDGTKDPNAGRVLERLESERIHKSVRDSAQQED